MKKHFSLFLVAALFCSFISIASAPDSWAEEKTKVVKTSSSSFKSYLNRLWIKVRTFAPKKKQSSGAAVAGIKGAEKGSEELAPYWKGEEESTLDQEIERYGIASNLMEQGQFAEAVVVLESFREEFPRSSLLSQVIFSAGLCQLESGNKEAATLLIKEFIESYPYNEFAADAKGLLASLEAEPS